MPWKLILLNIIHQNNCIKPRTTFRPDSVTIKNNIANQMNEASSSDPVIQLSVFARPQLSRHKQTTRVRASIGFLINLTPPLKRSNVHVTIHGVNLPLSFSVTSTRQTFSTVRQSLMLTQYENVKKKSHNISNQPVYYANVVPIRRL